MDIKEKTLILSNALIKLSNNDELYKEKIKLIAFLIGDLPYGGNRGTTIIKELKSWAITQGFNVEPISKDRDPWWSCNMRI